MGVRRNIVSNAAVRDAYVNGVRLLKNEGSGVTTGSLGIPGPAKELSTYDLFVVWHHWAMDQFTPPTQGDRNAAHRGPVFLPWHRLMLIELEAQLQRVLGNPNFGLPYWNWAADGDRPRPDQPGLPIWRANCMGGNGDPALNGTVTTGPFSESSGWRVEVAADSNGVLSSVSRPMRRAFNVGLGLPTKSDVNAALGRTSYDVAPWNASSLGFRNRIEGWVPVGAARLHNRVHVWVGGDMLISSSPSDPVFFLNHCNVDRMWAAWQARPGNATRYAPQQSAPATLFRHRIDDPMYSIFAAGGNGPTPRQMLNVAATYTYGSLAP